MALDPETASPPSRPLPLAFGGPKLWVNRLLAQAAPDTLAAWQPRLTRLRVASGAELLAAGQAHSHVYFPMQAVVAQMHRVSAEGQMCVSLVGSEGMVGCSAALGAAYSADSYTVVAAGDVWRLDVGSLREQMERQSVTRRLLLDYVAQQINVIAHAAVCSRFHDIEPHLCTRLLQLSDAPGCAEVALTQVQLAVLVGTRRERVNQVLGSLQAAGLVESRRGAISLLDRPGLQQRACACYASVSE